MIIDNKQFYQESLQKYGVSPLGVHWKNQQTQYKRFEVITTFLEHEIKKSSLIDAGCGFGDYYGYLQSCHLLPQRYFGIDCEEAMIFHAKQNYPSCVFECKNILFDPLPLGDYYICSGALNILQYKEIKQFIKRIYDHSLKGIVFNYLKGFTFTGVHQNDIFQILRDMRVDYELKEDYLENDFTIFLRK